MAYDGTLYASVSGNGFTSSCLEGIPFKISPKFKPPIPSQTFLPPDIGLNTASSALNTEYSFEVEEAVLKWSAEREKQREEIELRRQATLRKSKESNSSASSTDQDAPDRGTEETSQPLYENTEILKPAPAPRPKPRQNKPPTNNYANVTIPNPLIANISNDILQPTPIQSTSKEAEQNVEVDNNTSSKTDLDLTWFEKQDDPFDNLELNCINDMAELASVLQQSTNISPGREENGTSGGDTQTDGDNNASGTNNEGEDDDENMYENVNLVNTVKNDSTDSNPSNTASSPGLMDLSKLPPVPPRRDLVGRSSPLPPIGRSGDTTTNSDMLNSQTVNNSERIESPTCANNVNKDSTVYDNPITSFQPTTNTNKSISHKPPVKKPPRTFKYSRHIDSDSEQTTSDRQNNQNGEPNNSAMSSETELNFDSNHFGDNKNSRPVPAPRKTASPPPRPSSGQSWNRFSPLPPTPSNLDQHQPATVALPVISPGPENYSRLGKEAQTAVDNLVGMGFPRDRVVRAVEKLGTDEKEIVDFLCLVDQLTEKGYSVTLVETALLMFRNSMNQASAFLELFTQFQELGFSQDKIKEALVNTNNDREKTLDILTASS